MNSRSHSSQNWFYRWPASVKLSTALALILGTVLMPPPGEAWFLGVAILLVGAMLVARLSWWHLVKRLLWLSPFVLAVALTKTFQNGAQVSWQTVAIKSSLCVVTILVLINTTPFSAILPVLQRVRVPGLLVTTMVLMQRYLHVLSDEALRMRRARASRTFSRGRRREWQMLSSVIGQLFLRASDRAERIYQAMCARGWR